MDLRNKVALVTGASSGMGRLIALRLAQAGARLALVGRDPQRLALTADEARLLRLEALGPQSQAEAGEPLAISADVRLWDEVEQAVKHTVHTFGTVDILVNSAFWGPPASIADTTEEFWDRTLDTTLKGPFLFARAVAPYMQAQRSGRIINIGSKAGKVGEDARTAYCAAKWGLEGLTAALTEELTRYNIHVHLISPAATDTPWWRSVGANLTEQVLERMIPPETVAEAVMWVLSLPDQVHVPDVPVFNFLNPFEGKRSPFET
jgi:3-oxoacyl-[acyl-carrier protein] reductase